MSSSNYLDFKPSFSEPQVKQYGSHMVMTNVMKEMKTKFISLDSKFAETSNIAADVAECTFQFPERITGIQSISVASAVLPLTFYNISAALENNAFCIERKTTNSNNTSVFSPIIIPDGQYTIDQLIDAIKTLTSSFTIDFEKKQSKTKITNTYDGTTIIHFNVDKLGNILPSDIQLEIKRLNKLDCKANYGYLDRSADILPIHHHQPIHSKDKSVNHHHRTDTSYNINNTSPVQKWDYKSRLGWVLGFRKPSYTLSKDIPIYSEGVAQLATIKNMFLILDEFSTSAHSSSFHAFLPKSIMDKNVLAQVTIDPLVPWGGFVTATLHNGFLISDVRKYQGDRVDLQKCKIQWVNEFGRPMSFNQNDFSTVLELHHS